MVDRIRVVALSAPTSARLKASIQACTTSRGLIVRPFLRNLEKPGFQVEILPSKLAKRGTVWQCPKWPLLAPSGIDRTSA
jgi:hypothetical protein